MRPRFTSQQSTVTSQQSPVNSQLSTVNSQLSTITDGATQIDMILSPNLPILAKCRTPALLSVKAGAGLKFILYI
ncbi:hypothetical protein [Microcoleus sp. S13_C3]|uniref:hypothetical protein n=1 Tax=Microcoleus sp. S13_C3 TaxID=3055409 RepID=UPI002FCEDD1B